MKTIKINAKNEIDEKHHTGTIIHWAERASENRNQRIAITCYRCHEKSFYWRRRLRETGWSGLCHKCISEQSRANDEEKDSLREQAKAG